MLLINWCSIHSIPKLVAAPRHAVRSRGATNAPQIGRAPAPRLWLIPAATWLSNVTQMTTGVVFRRPGGPGQLEDVATLLGFCPRAHKCPRGAEELTRAPQGVRLSSPTSQYHPPPGHSIQKRKNCPRNVLIPWAEGGHCHPVTPLQLARRPPPPTHPVSHT